jgi:hypothetical protein
MAVGAVLASIEALFLFLNSLMKGTPERRAFFSSALLTLVAAGAAAGAVFTLLEPLRRRASWGDYVGWVLSVYVILAIVVAVGVLGHGDDAALLKEPAIIIFLLGTGTVTGVFCARVARRWARGDFS